MSPISVKKMDKASLALEQAHQWVVSQLVRCLRSMC